MTSKEMTILANQLIAQAQPQIETGPDFSRYVRDCVGAMRVALNKSTQPFYCVGSPEPYIRKTLAYALAELDCALKLGRMSTMMDVSKRYDELVEGV